MQSSILLSYSVVWNWTLHMCITLPVPATTQQRPRLNRCTNVSLVAIRLHLAGEEKHPGPFQHHTCISAPLSLFGQLSMGGVSAQIKLEPSLPEAGSHTLSS